MTPNSFANCETVAPDVCGDPKAACTQARMRRNRRKRKRFWHGALLQVELCSWRMWWADQWYPSVAENPYPDSVDPLLDELMFCGEKVPVSHEPMFLEEATQFEEKAGNFTQSVHIFDPKDKKDACDEANREIEKMQIEFAQMKADFKALEEAFAADNAHLAAENAMLKNDVTQLQAHKERVWRNKCRRETEMHEELRTFSPMPPIAEDAENEIEKTSEKQSCSASPSHQQLVHGFAIGSQVITHSLKTEHMNGLVGRVEQAAGDRVAVEFRFFLGVKAFRPENLSVAPAMSELSIYERAKAAHALCRPDGEDRPHDTGGKDEHPQKNSLPTSSPASPTSLTRLSPAPSRVLQTRSRQRLLRPTPRITT